MLATVKARKLRYFGHVIRKSGACLEKGDNTRHVTRKKEKRKTQNILKQQPNATDWAGLTTGQLICDRPKTETDCS